MNKKLPDNGMFLGRKSKIIKSNLNDLEWLMKIKLVFKLVVKVVEIKENINFEEEKIKLRYWGQKMI